eukprot:RCo035076
MRGQRVQLLTIAPFSVLTRSAGRPSLFHPATSASLVIVPSTGSKFCVIGTPRLCRSALHLFFTRSSRKNLLKGPMYEMNAEASRTSPVSSLVRSLRSWMVRAQRTFSSASPLTRRAARLSLSWVFLACISILSFSSRASSNCFTSTSSLDFSSPTRSWTFFRLALLWANLSWASASFSSLGRTMHRMRWYFTMFSTHAHSELAAKDLVTMLASLKPGLAMIGSTLSMQICGMLFWSKACSSFSHVVTLAIIFFAEAQLRSLGIFLGSAVSTITAALTITTSSGGFAILLSSVREFLSSWSSAASAASTMGFAAAR